MLCEPTPTRQARPNSERGDSLNSVEDRPLLLQHRMRDALRRQQCPPLLLSAVQPVVLYTHTPS